MGLMYAASGMMNGFVAVSLAQLLTADGVSLVRVSEIASFILIPSYISFLLTPLVDGGLPRRVWALLLALIAALCLGISIPLLHAATASGGHTRGTTLLVATLFIGYLASQIYSSALGGMVPNLVAPSRQSEASAWLNVAYLAMTGGGGALAVFEVRNFHALAAILVPLPIVLCAMPMLFVREERAPRAMRDAMGQLFTDLWATARQPRYLIALLVFVVPSATFALQNLFGGMGADFHASDRLTNLSVGLGFTIACSIGAALGGPLSNRFDRRLLFIAPAMLAALGSLAMVYGPHTPWVFAGGMFFYNLMAGINYTATSALVFQIVGRNNPLSATQYSVCIAACNLAITGALLTDGRGAQHSGAFGALTVDALLSLVLGALVLALVWRYGGGFPKPPIAEESPVSGPAAA